MRDGSTRKRPTSTQQPTWMPERVQVDRWRRHSRLAVLRELADGAHGLTLSRRLLNALLEELHISDDFDVLVGPVARLPARTWRVPTPCRFWKEPQGYARAAKDQV
jgi:hypothetical protein